MSCSSKGYALLLREYNLLSPSKLLFSFIQVVKIVLIKHHLDLVTLEEGGCSCLSICLNIIKMLIKVRKDGMCVLFG